MSVYSQPIEIRTKSVEKILEPIILQLSSLVNPRKQLNRPKGLSKCGDEIIKWVKISIDEFVDQGKAILCECPHMAEDFTIVLKDIQDTGAQLSRAISILVAQPINEDLRKDVSRSARSLLSSVTRLLILADLVDVQRLQKCLQRLREDISYVKETRDMGELTTLYNPINNALNELFALLQPRTQDLLNPTQREDLDLSQYCLRQACSMLMAASKAHLMHPELATAAANRIYCAQLVNDVIDKISDASNTTCLPDAPSPLQGQAVMSILQEIMDTVRCESAKEDNRNGAGLPLALDQLSAEIAALENSANLGERIHTSLKASLQRLRSEVNELLDVWEFQAANELGPSVDSITEVCDEIRHLIAKAALTMSSQTFLAGGDSAVTLLAEAARTANENRLIVAAENIQTQTTEVIDAALCLCALSAEPNAIRFARFTASELEQLAPQLINASKVLALRPTSTAAMENFDLFSNTYKSFMEMLQTAMDDLTDSTDLLITYDELLRDDLVNCERQASARQIAALMRDSKTFSARSSRVCSFLMADLEFYGLHGNAVDKITSAIGAIQERFLAQFSAAAKEACRRIKANEAVQVNLIHQAGETVLDRFQDLRETLEVLFGQKRTTLDSARTSAPSEDSTRRQDGDLASATSL
ncbi:Catenin alpha-1 [Sparganum proliferum]